MGNYIFSAKEHPAKGKVAKIKDNIFTRENEMPTDILRTGQHVQVLKSGNLHKSRPSAPDIAYSTVRFRDGTMDAYLTTNLEF